MILGVDPGVRKLGYALIEEDLIIVDAGILLQQKVSPNRGDQFERISQIFDFFEKLIEKQNITKVGIEKLFFTSHNQNNAEFVYGIRGALMMLFVRKGIPVQEFTPIEVKKYLTNNGKADKMLVQKVIMRVFKLQELPQFNDAADALGMAYLALKKK
ncbi:crossover junction endodeoxyribonuclease RuvC [candidate division SR1 bacterium]|nr:crossover junction endodeoxyribonuclease RuvC [candidate division SR1 bacterium]